MISDNVHVLLVSIGRGKPRGVFLLVLKPVTQGTFGIQIVATLDAPQISTAPVSPATTVPHKLLPLEISHADLTPHVHAVMTLIPSGFRPDVATANLQLISELLLLIHVGRVACKLNVALARIHAQLVWEVRFLTSLLLRVGLNNQVPTLVTRLQVL